MDDVLTTNGVYLPTNVKDKAKLLYKMISSRYIKRGESRKASMAVCFSPFLATFVARPFAVV